MQPGRGRIRALVVGAVLGGATWTQAASLPGPVPVSPGDRERVTGVRDGCPALAWAGVAEATSYELAVHELRSGPLAGARAAASPSAPISSGCSGGKYCPQGAVTREQLAMLLARVLRAHGAREVDGGVDHTCAFLASERVGCWGDNLGGQATPPAGTFVSVSRGYFHTCAVKTDGNLLCWGRDAKGQATPPGGL